MDANVTPATQTPVNGLTRSRRSHFSRKDSTPEGCTNSGSANTNNKDASKDQSLVRIVHEYERLMYYAKSPHSWALPTNWSKICESFPAIVRNKVTTSQSVDYNSCATNKANYQPYNFHRRGILTRSASTSNSFDVITID